MRRLFSSIVHWRSSSYDSGFSADAMATLTHQHNIRSQINPVRLKDFRRVEQNLEMENDVSASSKKDSTPQLSTTSE